MEWTPELVCLALAAICFLLATVGANSVLVPGGWVAFGLFFLSLFFLIPAFAVSLMTLVVILVIILLIFLIVFVVQRTRTPA